MRRGEIWTLQDGDYASKARPALVVQSDQITGFESVVLCLLTSFASAEATTRVPVIPSPKNGLLKTSYVMTEKIITVRANELGRRVGVLCERQMSQVSRQLGSVLGITAADLIN